MTHACDAPAHAIACACAGCRSPAKRRRPLGLGEAVGSNLPSNLGWSVIQAYVMRVGRIERTEIGKEEPLPPDAVWLDIVQPTPKERAAIEAAYGLTLPTPEEAREIEPSDRLYSEGMARFMT